MTTKKKTARKSKFDLKNDLRKALNATLPTPKKSWGSPAMDLETSLDRMLRESRNEAFERFVRKHPSLTRAQVEMVLTLADVDKWEQSRLIEKLIEKADGPLGRMFKPPEKPKPKAKAAKKTTKADKPAKKSAKKKAAKSKPAKKSAKASPSSAAPKAPAKSKRKGLTDRVLEVLESKSPAAVAKAILRKELGNVSGTGLDKAIAKLIHDEKIVGSDPYSLAGVVDDSTGPLFEGEREAAQ